MMKYKLRENFKNSEIFKAHLKKLEQGLDLDSADLLDFADYWLTIMKSEINKVLEGVEKDVSNKSKELMGKFGALEAIEIIKKYKQ